MWIVVLIFVALTAAFVIDATRTNRTYDALAAHRVRVTPTTMFCFSGLCGVTYDYRGTHFSVSMPEGQATVFFVDPKDPSVRMSAVSFESGPGGTTVDVVFAVLLGAGALVVSTTHVVRLRRRGMAPVDGSRSGPWGVPLAPEDDPVAKPSTGPEPPEPGVVAPGQYLRLRPGEPLDVVDELPNHHLGHAQVLLGGDELLLDTPHERLRYRVGAGAAGNQARVRRLVVVNAHHRAGGHVNTPDRFLVALDIQGRLVGRLDFSDEWEMSTVGLRRICADAGLEFSVERYDSDRDLLAARPAWVTAATEMAVDHPVEADIRDLGMALWLGTGIAVGLTGAVGMELVFATPVRFVVLAIAFAGLLVASGISAWGMIRWRRHLRR